MSIPKMTTDLAVIQKLSDLPNSTDGLTAAELKAKFDEAPLAIQKWINEVLVPSIIASKIPFVGSTEIDADNVDSAIRAVHAQIRDAASGAIVNGSVTKEKLAEELLERTYGGRPWVSVDTPGSAQNTADFPVGQIWLRPAFTVNNAAGTAWTATGCTTETETNKVTLTGNNTVTAANITQTIADLGQAGDRVYVLFGIGSKDSEITALTVALNGGAEQDASAGVFATELSGTSLTVKLSATWPATSLASGSVEFLNYAVVNVDAILRQTTHAKDMTDWGAYLSGLLPLGSYASPEEVYIQTLNGSWWPMGISTLPVSRGGMGLDHLSVGEMVYGNGGNTLTKLATPDKEGSFLRFFNGVPKWGTLEDVTTDGGYLRVKTGSYVGDGAKRSISLGISPIALLISPVGGEESCVLMQGSFLERSYTTTQTNGNNATYTTGVKLNGSTLAVTLTLRSGFNYTSTPTKLFNISGVTYKWAAIY